MRYLLFALAVVAFLYGVGSLVGAQSAAGQIEAGVGFVVFAVTLSGAGVIESIERLRKELAAAKSPAGSK